MTECYDCGEIFDSFQDCVQCGSENVGMVDPDFDEEEFEEEDEFEEDC